MGYIFKILLGGLGISMFLALTLSAIYSDFDKDGTVVDCYDRYGNQILGESCLVEGSDINKTGFIIFNVILGLILALIFITMGILFDHDPIKGYF